MKEKINLSKIFVFACLILSSLYLKAQNTGVRFNLNTAINNRINSGDFNITASELSLPGNRLQVSPDDAGGYTHLLFKDRNNITIDLTGIEIVCLETMRAITIENCTNFTIKGLSVDYDPLPFTQATITSMSGDKKTINFSFINGYSTDILQNDDRAKVQIFNTAGNLISPEYYNVTYSINTSNRTGSMTKTVAGGNENNGDILVLSSRSGRWGDHTVYANNCNNLKLDAMTLYSGPVFGFYETYCSGSQYINCKVMRRPNNTTEIRSRGVMRMRSVEADAFHSKYGNTPTYSGCEASHMADDGIAINGDFHVVIQSVNNSNTFKIVGKGGNTPNLINGEPIELVSNTGGRILPDATIQTIVNTGNLTSAECNWLNSQGFFGDADVVYNTSMKVYTITLAAGRNVTLPQGSVINNANRIGNGFSISGCKIGPNRSRGILVKASHGTIQNNQLTENWGPAIKIAPEYLWLEAGSSVDVDILNNTITNCHDAPIAVFAYQNNNSKTPAPAGAHDDIKIQGNIISGSTNPGIAVTSTTNLCISNNTISSPNNNLIRDFIATEFGRNTDPNRTIYTLNTVDVACNNSGVINVRSISLNPLNDFLAFNESVTITKSINPNNATNKNVTWSIVGNQNVGSITVDANGNAIFKASSSTPGIVSVCATSAENNTIVECATIEVGQQIDAITSIDGPSIVVPNATSTVTVNYSATVERKLVVILQNKNTNAWVHEYSITVPAGTGSENINFTIDPTLTNGVDTHQWLAFITTSPNGGFNEKLDAKYIFDVDVDNTAVRVKVTPESLFLAFNEQRQLQATVLNSTNQSVIWSSNSNIATVNSTGLVTAGPTAGTAIITATSIADNTQKAICTIQVGTPINEIRTLTAPKIISPGKTASVTVNYSATQPRKIFTYLQPAGGGAWVVSDIREVPAGIGSYTLDFSINALTPTGLNLYDWICYISPISPDTWNDKLDFKAEYGVDVENSGVIVSVNPNTAVITVGEQLTLNAQVIGAINTAVTWSIENGTSNIATVNPSTGVVTGVGKGTVNVIAKSNEDPNSIGKCSVTVGSIVDAISKVDGPNTVAQGKTVDVIVNYSSTKTQDIVVFLQTTGSSYTLASDWVVTPVGPGVNSINVKVTPLSTLNNGTSYRWVVQILSNNSIIADGFDEPVKVDSTFSVLDNELAPKLKVYPNPTNGLLNVIIENHHIGLNANIIDLSGRTLINTKLKDNKSTLDLTSLSNGIYLLITKDDNTVKSINKIVINR